MMRKYTAVGIALLLLSGCTRKEAPSSGAAASAAPSAGASNGVEAKPAAVAAPSDPGAAAANAFPLAGTVDTGMDTGRLETLCRAGCEHVKALNCKAKTGCETACVESFSLPVCGKEFEAFLLCSGKQPLTNWECNEGGVAALKDGPCDAEQAAIIKCAQASGAK